MIKNIKFVVNIRFYIDSQKSLEKCIKEVLKEGPHICISGVGEDGYFKYESTKTRLLKGEINENNKKNTN